MGRYVFKLPDVGEGTAEAEITAWHVKVGDRVEEDAPLVDVMTDKATVEITSPVAGVVSELNGEPGVMAPVGSAIVVLEVEGAGNAPEPGAAAASSTASRSPSPVNGGGSPAGAASDPPPLSGGGGPAQPVEGAAAPPTSASQLPPTVSDAPVVGELRGPGGGAVAQTHPPSPGSRAGQAPATAPPVRHAFQTRAPGDRPLASPAVRQRARDLGVQLQFVPGSGPAGRITHADLDAYLAAPGGPPTARSGLYAPRDGVEEVKIIGLRRKIAEKMAEAKRRIPHFMYAEEIDATELEALRLHLNATKRDDQPRLTLLPFLIRALVKVLPEHPQINATYDDEAGVLHRHAAVHCGVATQTPGGLMVPVVFHAEAMDVWAVAEEIARVTGAAKAGEAKREALSGSTITVTSLGPLGGLVHTPVINHPEVAIIGPNRLVDRPVVRGGAVAVRKMMNLSSSFDHRIVDGYDAAEFVQKIKALLEHPATLFME